MLPKVVCVDAFDVALRLEQRIARRRLEQHQHRWREVLKKGGKRWKIAQPAVAVKRKRKRMRGADGISAVRSWHSDVMLMVGGGSASGVVDIGGPPQR